MGNAVRRPRSVSVKAPSARAIMAIGSAIPPRCDGGKPTIVDEVKTSVAYVV
jgi:hypothetical protein